MGVKKLPLDWVSRQIGELTTCTAGGTPSTHNSAYWGGDIPWMNSGELNHKQVHAVEGRITSEGLANSSTKMIPVNSVLIGLAGQGKTRGTVAINRISLCTNQSIAAIFPNESFVPDYLFYNLENRYSELRELSDGGGGRGGLNLSIINKLDVPLPVLAEQKAIAEALSVIDGLISITKNAIFKTENTKQSILYPLLTGKASTSNVAKWQHQPLGEILEYEQPTKYLVNTNKHKDFGKYPVLTAGKSFILGYTDDEYGVYTKGETILFDDFTTDTKFVDFPFKVKSSACKMLTPRTGAINLRFVFEAIKHLKFQPYDHKRYWISEYSKLLLPLPDKHEQDSIAEVIKDFDLKLSLLKSELAKYEWLKQGMMHDLLTGEVRLV